MPSSYFGDAGGQQLVDPLDFHQAQAAGSHRGEPLQVAELGNRDPRLSAASIMVAPASMATSLSSILSVLTAMIGDLC
jgi:hypothetical protein